VDRRLIRCTSDENLVPLREQGKQVIVGGVFEVKKEIPVECQDCTAMLSQRPSMEFSLSTWVKKRKRSASASHYMGDGRDVQA
jgi:hypothetical protein